MSPPNISSIQASFKAHRLALYTNLRETDSSTNPSGTAFSLLELPLPEQQDKLARMVEIKQQKLNLIILISGALAPGFWLDRPQAKAKALPKPRVRLGLAWSSRGFGLGAWGLKAKPGTSLPELVLLIYDLPEPELLKFYQLALPFVLAGYGITGPQIQSRELLNSNVPFRALRSLSAAYPAIISNIQVLDLHLTQEIHYLYTLPFLIQVLRTSDGYTKDCPENSPDSA
ncbi:hypothetical protein DFH07DRAFT_1004107 [Mycena maculata]|uniref:Uncharacterized protein n=1 Tax=Mycena maculata TaxID=230809 RepID=A0AAD7MN23_9AGAR|nr:hypothetical protein DFH07DRAFT_1004107 [Mycena maculata]